MKRDIPADKGYTDRNGVVRCAYNKGGNKMGLEIKYKQIFKEYAKACEGIRVLTGEFYSSTESLKSIMYQESRDSFKMEVKGYLAKLPSLQELQKKVVKGTNLDGKEYKETFNKHVKTIEVIHRYLALLMYEYANSKSDYFSLNTDTLELYSCVKGYANGGILIIDYELVKKASDIATADKAISILNRYIEQMSYDLESEGVSNFALSNKAQISSWYIPKKEIRYLISGKMLKKVKKYAEGKIKEMQIEVDNLEQLLFMGSYHVRLTLITFKGEVAYNGIVALPTVAY